jgi:hypothetical protein
MTYDNAIIINGEVYVLDDGFDESNDCEGCALRDKCCGGFDLICSTLFDAGQGKHFIKADMPEPVFWHKGENPPSDDRPVIGYWTDYPEEGWTEPLYYSNGEWYNADENDWASQRKGGPDFWIDRPQYDKDEHEE